MRSDVSFSRAAVVQAIWQVWAIWGEEEEGVLAVVGQLTLEAWVATKVGVMVDLAWVACSLGGRAPS